VSGCIALAGRSPPSAARVVTRGPLAWFAVEGVLADQVVRAVWADGQLCCDRLLESRARLLVDLGLGAEFGSEAVPRRYRASLQATRRRCC
jgi:hypothetical protein